MKDSWNSKNVRRLYKNFFLVKDENNNSFLLSPKFGIYINIKPGGYIPKSGLLVAEELSKMEIKGKTLDIGTGETGILANCLLALGASQVFATDIDQEVIQWAQQASNRSLEISWNNCDLYPNNISDGSFSLIVSNPPQMPMPFHGHAHDYGGKDGRDCILRIITNGKRLLSPDGKLILLSFDFLGVENFFGKESIIKFAKKNGLKTRIISRCFHSIRKGGKTEENIFFIEKMYPGYLFKKDAHENYYHEILVLEMTHSF